MPGNRDGNGWVRVLELLEGLPRSALEEMSRAGAEALTCQRVLAKTGDSVLSEVLADADAVESFRHYPSGDVFDREFHSQYYYHQHPVAACQADEVGHFHTFLRPLGMPEGVRPAPLPDLLPPDDPDDALSHLVAISVDGQGQPVRLFTTNRWVTGETWYAAEDVIAMLDCFAVELARPSWPLNRWITAMLRLCKPLVADLLRQRDVVIAERAAAVPDVNVFEDPDLEVASETKIHVPRLVAAVDAALSAGGRG